MIRNIGIFAIALSTLSFAHADWRDKNAATATPTNNVNTNSDQTIANKIREKIGSGWISKGYQQVSVQVNNGIVTLQGSVKTWADKDAVEKDVRNIEGVKGLNSQISVTDTDSKEVKKDFAQDSAGSPADEQLNKKIRDNVSRGWLWNSYKDVTLNTNNGIVTLNGWVSSPSDQQKLISEIQKVDGVKSVSSNLKIKNP